MRFSFYKTYVLLLLLLRLRALTRFPPRKNGQHPTLWASQDVRSAVLVLVLVLRTVPRARWRWRACWCSSAAQASRECGW